jgi:uncharacterized cupin superfamily protein
MPSPKPEVRPPALDPKTVPVWSGSSYPEPFRAAVMAREGRALGEALGLTNFGVHLMRLPPGAASSQRHWHTHEDEFVYMLEGEAQLITDAGAQILSAGMCAGFPAGKPDGHHLVNQSGRDAVFLVVGDRREGLDACEYSDIDMSRRWVDGERTFFHKDGRPW